MVIVHDAPLFNATAERLPEFLLGAFLMEEKQMDYKSSHWRQLRLIILRRDAHRCQMCKRYGKFREANTVHHIFPCEFYDQYQWEHWNLISLCNGCHDSLHNRETHMLTKKGLEFLERTARKNGIEVTDFERRCLTTRG